MTNKLIEICDVKREEVARRKAAITVSALHARAAKGIEEEVEQGVRIPLGRGFAGRIAAERRAIAIPDVDHADILNPILREKGIKSLLGSEPEPSLPTTPATDAKIEALIKQLTLEEKVTMIHGASSFQTGGVPRLNIPPFVTSDGPHGVRLEHGTDYVPDAGVYDSSTYLPVGVCLASTWNPQLGYQFGSVLGREANFRGKDVILGPGINIIRSPLNGRNFEYMPPKQKEQMERFFTLLPPPAPVAAN